MKLGSFVDDVSFCGAFIAIFVSFMVSFKMPKRGPLTDRWADVFYWMTQPAGRKKLNIDGGGGALGWGDWFVSQVSDHGCVPTLFDFEMLFWALVKEMNLRLALRVHKHHSSGISQNWTRRFSHTLIWVLFFLGWASFACVVQVEYIWCRYLAKRPSNEEGPVRGFLQSPHLRQELAEAWN